MKNIIILIAVCFLMNGCVKSDVQQDRIEVDNRLRLNESSVDIPESNAIRLRVIAGSNRTILLPRRINIRKGAITFRGADGFIRLTTNDVTVIKSSSLDHEVEVKMHPGTQNIQFNLSQEPFRMSINWSTHPSLTDYCKSNNCSYVDFCPELITMKQITSIDIDIPIDRTDDFEGEVGDWVIQSNWK
jgi:hypothetical protein